MIIRKNINVFWHESRVYQYLINENIIFYDLATEARPLHWINGIIY